MRKLLNLQSKIITFNTNALLLIIIYSIVNISRYGFVLERNKSLIVFVILFVFNFILYKLDYFKRKNVYIVFKLILFFIALYMLLNQVNAMRFFYIFYMLLIGIELSLVLTLEKNIQRVMLGLFGITILIIVGFSYTSKNTDLWELFFSLLIILTGLYSYYIIYRDNKNEVLSKLKVQTTLLIEAAKTSEEFRTSQNKFKLIHEEMAKQKYDLEVANKRLNKMTAEIYTQNALLRYISSVLEIEELLEVVTDAIMGTIGVDTCSLVLFDERNKEYLYKIKSNYQGNHMINLKLDAVVRAKMNNNRSLRDAKRILNETVTFFV
jgi:hypothetical protein